MRLVFDVRRVRNEEGEEHFLELVLGVDDELVFGQFVRLVFVRVVFVDEFTVVLDDLLDVLRYFSLLMPVEC
jgi:hypothetical protein